jgi:hypothetical protein
MLKFFQCKPSFDHLSRMSGESGDTNSAEVTPKRQKSAYLDNRRSFDDDLKQFDDLFTVLVGDLHGYSSEHGEVTDALQWFKKVC